MIGAALRLSLSDSWNVYGTSKRKSSELNPQILKLDLSPNEVEGFHIPEVDWVIYCASVSGFVQCRQDPERSEFVNAIAPTLLAAAAEKRGSRFLYLSSNSVFDCETGEMKAGREYSPRGIYGRHKSDGEVGVLSRKDSAVLRLSKVIGQSWPLIDGWATQLCGGLGVDAFDDYRSSPVLLEDVVRGVEVLIENGKAGVFQMSSIGDLSYYEVALLVAKHLSVSSNLVTGVSAASMGVGPDEVMHFASMDVGRAQSELGFRARRVEAVIDDICRRRI